MKSRANRLFIDVGVGFGKEAEKKGRPVNCAIIGLETDTNRYNIMKDIYVGTLLNVVASDKDGEIECWEHPKFGVQLSMTEFHSVDSGWKRVKKKTVKLDSLEWESFNEIHIWADVQGSELLMLKGATKMLLSGRVVWIQLEVMKNPFAVVGVCENWVTGKQVYEFLDECGFKPSVELNQLPEEEHKDVVFTRMK